MSDDEPWQRVFSCFKGRYGSNLARIPEPGRSVVVVVSVDGVIDNGGFVFFLEMDWPDGVAHRDLAAHYRRLGLEPAAVLLEAACDLCGDLRGKSYSKRARVFARRRGALEPLDSAYYAMSNDIDTAINRYSHEFLAPQQGNGISSDGVA